MRRPYEPNAIRSGLLAADHKDRYSAALSVAANRASKVGKLRASGNIDLARNYADSLVHDVLEHIANGELLVDPRLAQELANMAIVTRDICYHETMVSAR